ncbi:uncharacterized protein LOC128725705 [Anopheles nili]|uniref:uncharacterized protein LOC128725705 n=1 Tax=Anopheles nili TaxID=185578 RepID=UPI00237BCD57|nr:uncharacterized protein LOC128725705 [Anopheles nili]
MSRNLCDETFPGSLLIEFDELDDEIPISPELPKRHQPDGFGRHHSTLTVRAGAMADKATADDRNGSRTVISGSSNTSSGHSSLSTEGENRSASSDRDLSRDLSKRQLKDVDLDGTRMEQPSLKTRKFRPPRSMESLLQQQGHSGHFKKSLPPRKRAGLRTDESVDGDCTGNVSVLSNGPPNQQHQLYQRHRAKYGHVQSKVKQLIDEMKPTARRDRMTLVRHKSMPETSFDIDPRHEHDDTLEQETDMDALRAMVREMKLHVGILEQQLNLQDLHNTNAFNELAALKCKNSALRIENDFLLEQERVREQRRQLLRHPEQHPGGSCYGSQSSLHKAIINCTTATQTSPQSGTDEPSFELLFAASPPAITTGSRPLMALQASSTVELDTAIGEFSPDYEQLLPVVSRDGEPSDAFEPKCQNGRCTTTEQSPAPKGSETGQAPAIATSPRCRDCCRRKKKRKSRKQKLVSLFCIRRHDDSFC